MKIEIDKLNLHMYVKKQRNHNSQNNVKKKKKTVERLTPPGFQIYYKARIDKTVWY